MTRVLLMVTVGLLGAAACTSGTGAPVEPSSGAWTGGSSGGGAARPLDVVVVYRPVCGPEPRPSAGATSSGTTCPEEPVNDVEVVATRADGSVAARGTTTATGRVTIDLIPGTYVLSATPAAPPRVTPRPTTVTVGIGPVPTVTLIYESSMQ